MANEKFTVTLEIGSSKITAVAGTKQPDGAIQVLAIAQEDSGSFIRKGRILNIDKMTQCIKSIKDKLEKRLNRQINKAYVGVGGMGMHTLLNCINRTFPETTKVTEDMIDELRDENIQTAPAGYEIIDVIEQEYQLGTMSSTEPVGTLTSNLKGQFLNVVTRASVRKQIEDVFYNIGINVIEIPVSFLALANATLKDNERQSGCVFVDMGAQTTSVAVFKGNILRHAAILPIGGWNITNDIAQTLQISLEEAENLKLKHDFAIEEIDENSSEIIVLEDGRSFPINELKNIVSARLEEIIANVNHQVEISKLRPGELVAGIVVCGGVSNTSAITEAFKIVMPKFDKVRVEQKMTLQYRVNKSIATDFNTDFSYNSAVSMLDKGTENCDGGELGKETGLFEPQKPEPETPQSAPEQPIEPETPQPPKVEHTSSGGGNMTDEEFEEWMKKRREKGKGPRPLFGKNEPKEPESPEPDNKGTNPEEQPTPEVIKVNGPENPEKPSSEKKEVKKKQEEKQNKSFWGRFKDVIIKVTSEDEEL